MSNNMLTLMDQFFDDAFRPINSTLSRFGSTSPAVNVTEFDDRYEISVTIAGIDPQKIDIHLDDGIVEISYNHDEKKEENDSAGSLLRQEFSHYSFTRSIALPKNVVQDSIKAKGENGILKITIEKSPQAKPRKIEIE